MDVNCKYILTTMLLAVCCICIQAEDVGPTFHRGDTVIISQDMQHYLTGEEPSEWVYDVRHTIEQVGGTRFPNGLLLHGIMSWVGRDDVYRIGAEKTDSTTSTTQSPLHEVTDTTSTTQRQLHEVPDTTSTTQSPQHEVTDTTYMRQLDRFSIGVRGGAASLMHRTEAIGNWRCGFDAILDLQYAHYWQRSDRNAAYGILTGVGIGYSRSGLGSGVDTTYNRTADGHSIQYTISTDNINEKDGQLQVEVPLMFSMVTNKGFFLNIGPRVIIPAYAHYNQAITNPKIVADFTDMGVKVENEAITGLVKDNQMNTKGRWGASKVNVLLGAELGYEWTLRNQNALGLGVYGNYSVYTLYNNSTDNKSLISVGLPSADGAAPVDILSATDTYAKGLGYFDAGVKLVYHFNFWK